MRATTEPRPTDASDTTLNEPVASAPSMRAILVAFALTAVVLAGCAEDSDPDPTTPDVKPSFPAPEKPAVVTHPDYGFVTMDELVEGTVDDFPTAGLYNASFPPGSPYYWKKPMYHSFGETPTSIDFEAITSGVSGGAGIAVFGPLAVAGPTSGPMHIINIIDPANPTLVSVIDVPNRDADFIAYPDGRLVVVSTGGGGTMFFVDVTDPFNPELVASLDTPNGNHNIAVVPGTPIVYNSPSDGASNSQIPTQGNPAADGVGETDIIDASNPDNPILAQTWQNGYGCHDMTFYMNATEGKFRGYCAGIEKLQIWDLTNVTDPSVISEWGWPLAGVHDATSLSIVSFAHLAIPNHDASVLILGDETGGGAAPGCDVSANVGGTTVTGPLGNLWFYDITDETNPVLRGSYSPSATDQRGSCTAHFGRVIEDTDHVVMGFYSAGVVLVDFTDPQNPVEVDHYEQPLPVIGEGEGPGTVWDVWYYQGYLFTGDTAKGMDVLTVN